MVEGSDLSLAAGEAVLTRGLGRSYGDASLPPAGRGPVASSLAADRVLSFDEERGILRAQAGLSLERLAALAFARGWFVPVTPGTRHVTLGGMVAADVHGKNHHVSGTIGRHVDAMTMRLPDGRVEEIRDDTHPDLFRATLGGMGLTGHVLDATIRLERVPSRFVVEEATACPDLDSLVDGLERSGAKWPFTVAWSDFLARGANLGRGVLQCGRWARKADFPLRRRPDAVTLPVPFEMPGALLRDRTVRAFNAVRYALARSASGATCVRSADSFFYPLDALEDWNLLYGRRGLTQYQCVLPRDPSMRSYRRLAAAARGHGPGPFLVVIKDCGDEGTGLLSFPRPGISFAMDFPVHDGTPALVAALNEVVIGAGGRVYLAKDAFTTAEAFAAMEPRLGLFLDVKRRIDPDGRIASALGARLGLNG